jgi:uncharacterized protein involved in response to NO
MALIPIEDLHRRPPPTGLAPFALGFRPFFLAAGIYAVLLMALWMLVLQGSFELGAWSPLVWHGHEMLFGFSVAVIAGFLLTAAQNWTGIRTPSGTPLAALFLLWLAGRLAFLIPGLPPAWVAVVDLAFLPVLAWVLALPILKARQMHNYPFPIMLLVLTAANALVHLDRLGWTSDSASLGLHLGVYVVVTMIVVMGGRVIPSFTDNKLRTRARRWAVIERLVVPSTLAAMLASLLAPDLILTALVAAIAALVHFIRLAGWYTNKFWAEPLLWVLHLGYAWIALGFALLAPHPYLRPRHAGAARRARAQGRARRRLHLPQPRRQQGHRRLHLLQQQIVQPAGGSPYLMTAMQASTRSRSPPPRPMRRRWPRSSTAPAGRIGRRTGARRFIAYFQAYTNTYAHVDELRALYDSALAAPDVIGLAIGTRPDCVPPPVLDLLAEYLERGHEVWLELGLQSSFDATLARSTAATASPNTSRPPARRGRAASRCAAI